MGITRLTTLSFIKPSPELLAFLIGNCLPLAILSAMFACLLYSPPPPLSPANAVWQATYYRHTNLPLRQTPPYLPWPGKIETFSPALPLGCPLVRKPYPGMLMLLGGIFCPAKYIGETLSAFAGYVVFCIRMSLYTIADRRVLWL
jgi:hypothetical protein